MADNFDAVDIVFSALALVGVTAFKDKSPENQAGEHIVVNSPSCGPSSFATNDSAVNVNIFVPVTPNAMVNRPRLEAIRSAVYAGIESSDTSGYYCYIDNEFSALIENAKKGFDCFTIRYLITINK